MTQGPFGARLCQENRPHDTRQEELLQILSSKLTLEEIEELFINLCPYVYR